MCQSGVVLAETPGVGYRGKEISEIWDDELNDQGMLVQVHCMQTLHPGHAYVLGFTNISSVSTEQYHCWNCESYACLHRPFLASS